MVRIPSVNPKFETGDGLNREDDVQALLAKHLEPLGPKLERWDVFPGRPRIALALSPGTTHAAFSSTVISTWCQSATARNGPWIHSAAT